MTTKARRLISSNEAKPAKRQHTKPCGDCPWSRRSLNGWTGDLKPEEWRAVAHGDALVYCHTKIGAQCAGAAIYRANICKRPRNADALRLPADRVSVFASPVEFVEHHYKVVKR